MRTYLITGGTDGMGRGLGLLFLARGDRVIAVASGEAKGKAFLEAAERIGAGDRAQFWRADLSTVAGMKSVASRAVERLDRLDGLVFAAQRFRPEREVTEDGVEYTFAVTYLNRHVLAHDLAGLLERAEAPVIFSLSGSGGLPGKIFWDDPTFARGRYTGMRAAMQASRSVDLDAADFARRHPDSKIRYVLYNPMFVKTAMADPLKQPMKGVTKVMEVLFAQRVEQAVPPMARLMDDPPREALSAFRRGKPLPVDGEDFDPERADRLRALTERLLAEARG
ncbi:SDR family NAD(P)-dependent oxidoreductase [Glycomyces harbinensis]|uniref:NAD(P)-dependent dehydrogenase, short-chain alcohol dehydrogenase family n=1 Tax=Glycomyces harbinensis TaxID=58114 RepID=A0A1G7BX92_9ACTN|nr:SDR family NAD(P)-dependent oxidoreductase [Glycomyces harbinensis]SDE31728.1 NAD(P)-dependent dehydrogenase, short-chain alcohol dehydrogenase family [Glycomyces harbinensis]